VSPEGPPNPRGRWTRPSSLRTATRSWIKVTRLPGRSEEPVKQLAGEKERKPIDFISPLMSSSTAILVAVLGGYLTYTAQKSLEENRARDRREDISRSTSDANVARAEKERDQSTLEVQTVAQFMPYLTSEDSTKQRVAITAISALANTQLAIRLAALNPTQGSEAALKIISSNATDEGDRKEASLALKLFHSEGVARIGELQQAAGVARADYGSAMEEVVSLHDKSQDEDFAREFDNPHGPVANPFKIKPLLSSHEMAIRRQAFEVLDSYIDLLAAYASDANATQIRVASQKVIHAAKTYEQSSSSFVEGVALANDDASTVVTTGLSTNVEAGVNSASSAGSGSKILLNSSLFLTSDIKSQVVAFDPTVQKVCKLMSSDLNVMRSVNKLDFNSVIDHRMLTLRDPKSQLTGSAREAALVALPELKRERDATDQKLEETIQSMNEIALLHHALAADIQRYPDPVKRVSAFVANVKPANR